MIGQANEEHGYRETQPSSVAVESNQPGQAWSLVEEIRGLVGEDAQPDPLFFEESWTLGAVTAVQNLRRRRWQQTEGVLHRPDIDNLGAQSYVQQRAWWVDRSATTHGYAVVGQGIAEWPVWRGEEAAARREDASQEWEPLPAGRDCQWTAGAAIPMTPCQACYLLGVTADSSWAEIKTAYRRMAGQWHPDRMQHCSEETRRLANDQMIAINQAYGLLRERMMQLAA